jgi:nucleotide-binding universal stress UspA family protein
MKRILVPVTLTGESHAALGIAAHFAQACNATVVMLHVLQRGLVEGGASAAWALPLNWSAEHCLGASKMKLAMTVPGAPVNERPIAEPRADLETDDTDQVETKLDAIAAGIRPRVPVEVIVRSGDPAGSIVRQAKELAADAIVMCTHGYRGWWKWLHRNTARQVVKHAPCAVWQLSPGRKGPGFTLTLANCDSTNWLREPASPLRSVLQILFPGWSATGTGNGGLEFHFTDKSSSLA